MRGHRARDEAGVTLMNLRDLKLRARALLAPRRVERELDEELAFHIERETQKHIANGISPAEARTRAMARFGSVTARRRRVPRRARHGASSTTWCETSCTPVARSAARPWWP